MTEKELTNWRTHHRTGTALVFRFMRSAALVFWLVVTGKLHGICKNARDGKLISISFNFTDFSFESEFFDACKRFADLQTIHIKTTERCATLARQLRKSQAKHQRATEACAEIKRKGQQLAFHTLALLEDNITKSCINSVRFHKHQKATRRCAEFAKEINRLDGIIRAQQAIIDKHADREARRQNEKNTSDG